jgi:hypothetical protein
MQSLSAGGLQHSPGDFPQPVFGLHGIRRAPGQGGSSPNIFLQASERPTPRADGPSSDIFFEALALVPESVPLRITTRQQSQFESFFLDRIESLTMASADEFFTQLVGQINDGISAPFRASVAAHISLFVTINPSFVPSLVRSGFLATLDLTDEAMFEPNLRTLIACVGELPSSVTSAMVRTVAAFNTVPENALKLLKFMSVFLKKCNEHPQMLQIVDIFLEDALNYQISDQFIYFVYHISKNPRCASFAKKCIRIFAAGLASQVTSVSKAARATFCQIPFEHNDVPIADLLESMNIGHFAAEGVEILARFPILPPSLRLVAALMRAVGQTPLVVICLMKLSRDPNGADLLLRSPEWMTTMEMSDAFVVLLAICIHSPLRQRVIETADVHRLLTRVGREGNAEEIDTLVRLIRRLPLTEAFIKALDAVRFFEHFLLRALWSDSIQLKKWAILLMDRLGRPTKTGPVWADGFRFFIQALPALVQIGGITAQDALVPALVLVSHQPARQHFMSISGELTKLLAGSKIGPSSAKYQDILLRYLKTCNSK